MNTNPVYQSDCSPPFGSSLIWVYAVSLGILDSISKVKYCIHVHIFKKCNIITQSTSKF